MRERRMPDRPGITTGNASALPPNRAHAPRSPKHGLAKSPARRTIAKRSQKNAVMLSGTKWSRNISEPIGGGALRQALGLELVETAGGGPGKGREKYHPASHALAVRLPSANPDGPLLLQWTQRSPNALQTTSMLRPDAECPTRSNGAGAVLFRANSDHINDR